MLVFPNCAKKCANTIEKSVLKRVFGGRKELFDAKSGIRGVKACLGGVMGSVPEGLF